MRMGFRVLRTKGAIEVKVAKSIAMMKSREGG
jgi:hypothetical protein